MSVAGHLRGAGPARGLRSSRLPATALSVLLLAGLLYLALPELTGAGKDLVRVSRLHPIWLLTAAAAEAAAWLAYALLVHRLLRTLPKEPPSLSRVFRVVLATTGLSHVVPGGAAGSMGLGLQLLVLEGVPLAEAGLVLGTAAIGSAIVLNVVLWLALLVTIPLAGMHPLYVLIALLSALALLAAAGLGYLFTTGEQRSQRVVRAVGRRISRIGEARAEAALHRTAEAATSWRSDPPLLRATASWAALNWLLDAACLWCCFAAFGERLNPVLLFVAFGIANVLAVIPLTPGGLGVIEVSTAALVVSFGTGSSVAAAAVLSWRLLSFWLPIPFGGIAYLTLVLGRPSGSARDVLADDHQ